MIITAGDVIAGGRHGTEAGAKNFLPDLQVEGREC